MNEKLEGKVVIVDPDQALRYDDTLKVLLGYISKKYDYHVTSCIQHKDKLVGVKLLVTPTAPTKPNPEDTNLTMLDKDGEDWIMYQLQLKKYIDLTTKLDDDIQHIFNIVLGQCSPSMKQALSAVKRYKLMKEEADSINIIKTIEKICYNYQPHEYPPLGVWEALYSLGKVIQPENIPEADHYKMVETMIEVCKASVLIFALFCIHTVDMAVNMLHNEGEISLTGKYKDGVYLKLNDDERELVSDRVEEIYITTRFLSLSSNKKFSASKQELRNNLVKGKDNYPRTVARVLKYLQFHSLHANKLNTPLSLSNKKQLETAFVTDGDQPSNEDKRHKSKTCRLWQNSECDYKEKNLWSECSRNEWSHNKGKTCNEKRELALYTVEELEEDLRYNDEDLEPGDLFNTDNKIDNGFEFYSPLVFDYEHMHYVFVEWCDEVHVTIEPKINKRKIDRY